MDKSSIVGRVLMHSDYSTAQNILKQFTPMLKKTKFVEQIYAAVQSEFSEESYENRRLIFIATVYQVYQPLSFLPTSKRDDHKTKQAVGKLPAGVRDEMARCLSFNNPEMVNHFKTFAEPQMKPFNTGPERPFKTKVMQIVERFKVYSINESDYQYNLGL